MIASENYTSAAVMQAVGSVLTNKYAEGYPGRRYYGGCEYVDVVEESGASSGPASCSVPSMPTCSRIPVRRPTWPSTWPCLEPGDVVLGLDLAHGGHLTHGMKLNISGKLYHFHSYGVTRETRTASISTRSPRWRASTSPS